MVNCEADVEPASRFRPRYQAYWPNPPFNLRSKGFFVLRIFQTSSFRRPTLRMARAGRYGTRRVMPKRGICTAPASRSTLPRGESVYKISVSTTHPTSSSVYSPTRPQPHRNGDAPPLCCYTRRTAVGRSIRTNASTTARSCHA